MPLRPLDPNEMTDEEIDDMEFRDLYLQGCFVLSSYQDKFDFYPAEGFPHTGTLQDNLPFDLAARRIAPNDRLTPFVFKYLRDGVDFEARFFTRVQAGKQTRFNVFQILS